MEEKIASSAVYCETQLPSVPLYHYHNVRFEKEGDKVSLIYERLDVNGKIHVLVVYGIRWWDSNDQIISWEKWETHGKDEHIFWGWPVYSPKLTSLNQILLAAHLPLFDLSRPYQLSTTHSGGTVHVGKVIYYDDPYQLQHLFDTDTDTEEKKQNENDHDRDHDNALPSLQIILNFMCNRFMEPYVRIIRNTSEASGGLNLIPEPGYYDELFEFDFEKFYLYILYYKDISYTSFSTQLMHRLCNEMLLLSTKNKKKYKRLYCHFSGSLKNFDFNAYQAMTAIGRTILAGVADRVKKETQCVVVAGLTDCLRVFIPPALRDQENTQLHLVDAIFKSTDMKYKCKKLSRYVATPSCRKFLHSQFSLKELKKICINLYQSAIAVMAICTNNTSTKIINILDSLTDSQSRFQPFLFSVHKHGVKEKDIDLELSERLGIDSESVEFLVYNPATNNYVEVLTAHILGISFEVDALFDRNGLEKLRHLPPEKETHVIHSYLYYEKFIDVCFNKIEFLTKYMSCEKGGCSESQKRHETRTTKDTGKELLLNELYFLAKCMAKDLKIFRGPLKNVPVNYVIFHKSMLEDFETWALDIKQLPLFWKNQVEFLKYCHLLSLIRQIRITETKRLDHRQFYLKN